jgi:uncharacterized caspase-like protein
MVAEVPSPQTTLVILLGASEWPLFPGFQDSEAFSNTARELKAYFLDPKRFGLSPENVLDVFNSNKSPDELDAQIGRFLERRLAAMKATGHTARDLLVYFVGHGGFVGRDSDFYLAIRRTRMENPRASGIPMLSLADTLTEKARHLRRIIILDCCFAAAAFSAFQADPAQVAIEKTKDAFEVRHRGAGFPAKGTTLLCSSSQKSPSLLLPDGSSTMFTKAFLDALLEGLPPQRERLSLREVKDLAADLLSEIRNAPRPVVLSPDQSEGDVADIPFFPNPRAEEERARQAEEERRRLAEEEKERARKAEEEERSMTIRQKIQQQLRDFNFKALFVDELGWDILNEHALAITVEGVTYVLRPLVEKRGVKVFVCDPDADGKIPTDGSLRKIEREVTHHAYEHFIIYMDAVRENQVWQWVKREEGKRQVSRMHRYHRGQSGELLAQKLERLVIGLEEEELVHMAEVIRRVADALNKERVTRRFYDRFEREHATFLNLIEGIAEQADGEWYASLMLNRLMFVYFIQRKGFLDTKAAGRLDGDPNYLSNRLRHVQQERGEGQFHSFYRYFLLKLFHEGLSQREHAPELEALLGTVPYLNGGLFDVHVLERAHSEINIPDEAFEQLFAFFDEFDWYLDDRPLRKDSEINPDVLGYIFEKYINQKQMGAYYTKEDITEYISKSTILPFLLDAAEQKCQIAFRPDGPVWSLLRENPDAYIYDAVKKGCDIPLPLEIEVGMHDVAQRSEWNKPAPEAYALPTETWREVVARRTRCQDLRAKLGAGSITSANDLITSNLNSRRFAEDVITYCTGTDLLRALYDSIEQVTVLDPTCGSGAFLFSALTILEGLYEACLERMQDLVEEREVLDAAIPPERWYSSPDIAHFRAILERVKHHPSRTYFIYKSIIIRNLYGVDIMEEATEICKLRLFLKLVSQVERFDDIEPLPDIDFNIRTGNTLVGFASYEETTRAIEGKTVGKAIQSQMIFDDRQERIEQKAKDIEQAFEQFRELQTKQELDPVAMVAHKRQLQQMLGILRTELDGYLASEYGIDRNSIPKREEYDARFAQWQRSHQPFHWWVEFYGIMKRGGFDVIIGNPPYVEYRTIVQEYRLLNYVTLACGNLYAFTMERAARLVAGGGRFGMIVPASASCTDGYLPLQHLLLEQSSLHISSFSDQRGKLFDIPHPRLCIITYQKSARARRAFSTSYLKLGRELRDRLFERLEYIDVTSLVRSGVIPRYGSAIEHTIHAKVRAQTRSIGGYLSRGSAHTVYYTRKLSWFVQVTPFIPSITDAQGHTRNPSELKTLTFSLPEYADMAFAALNSTLFYWFITTGSDCRNLNMREVLGLPLAMEGIADPQRDQLRRLSIRLAESLQANSEPRPMRFKGIGGLTIQCLFPGRSKPIIDEIDRVLAQHYGFTDEELDFIINYDIKYRVGQAGGDEEEE